MQIHPPRGASLTGRLAARLAGAAALLLGAAALLFLLLESGVAGDPARAEAGPRAGPAELGAARLRLGMVKDYRPAALRLELLGPPRRLSLSRAGGAIVLREADGRERGRLELAERTVIELAADLTRLAAALDPPAQLACRLEDAALADFPAAGLAAGLDGAQLALEPGFPAALPWAEPRPLLARLGSRLAAVARLDLGVDRAGRPAAAEVRVRALRSLAYALPAFLITTALALLLALLCAARRGLLDRALMAASAVLMSVSALALIPLLRRWFTADLGLFSLRPWSAPYLPLLALPALTWILIAVWPELRLYRTLAVEEAEKPWIAAARARGLPARRLLWRHLAPNLAAPVLAHAAVVLPYLLLGSLLLERAYDLPGLGEYLVDALARRDARALEAATLAAAAAFLLAQALASALAARIDPRLRLGREAPR